MFSSICSLNLLLVDSTETPVLDPPMTEPAPTLPKFVPDTDPEVPSPSPEPEPFTLPDWAKPGQEPAPKA